MHSQDVHFACINPWWVGEQWNPFHNLLLYAEQNKEDLLLPSTPPAHPSQTNDRRRAVIVVAFLPVYN